MSDTGSAEELLISSVLRSGDLPIARDAGVEATWFSGYPLEWEWLSGRFDANRRTPTVADFKRQFPTFDVLSADDVGLYAQELKQAYTLSVFRSHMLDAQAVIQRDKTSPHVLDHAEMIVREGLAKAFAVQKGDSRHDFLLDRKTFISKVRDAARQSKIKGQPGIPTGFPTIDSVTGGLQNGWFSVLAARPNVGKTAVMNQMMAYQMLKGHRVVCFSGEMTRHAVNQRLVAMLSYLQRAQRPGKQPFNPHSLMTGIGTRGKDLQEFLEELAQTTLGSLVIVDKARGALSTGTIQRELDSLKPQIAYVDYIQITQPGGNPDSFAADWQNVARVSFELSSLAGELAIPIVAASQIKREDQSTKGVRPPELDGLSRSDAIGQDADLVITMTDRAPTALMAKVVKFRYGPKGRILRIGLELNKGRVEEINADEFDALVSEYRTDNPEDDEPKRRGR